MIKKLLISLFVVVGLGISYIFAEVTGEVVNFGSSVNSIYNNQYNMLVNNRGLLYTRFAGMNGKQVLMFYKGNYFTWTFQGLPYISINAYSSDLQRQGVVSNFLMCDKLNSGDLPNNCTEYNYMSSSGYALNIIKNSNKRFYGTYYQDRFGGDATKGPIFCFSSDDYEISTCFYGCWHANCGSYGDHIGGFSPYRNLGESLDLSLDLADINQSKLGSYPGRYEGGVVEGSIDSTINNNIEGDYTYSQCTYGEMLKYFEHAGYSKYLCYAGSNDRNYYDPTQTYSFTPGTGADLNTIYAQTNDGMSWFDWYNYWRGMYNGGTGNVDNAQWQQQPAVLRLRFYSYLKYGGENIGGAGIIEFVKEYCLMKQMITGDALNNIYHGQNQIENLACKNIVDSKLNGTYDQIMGGGSGSLSEVPISVNRGGVGNLSGGSVSDPLTFIQNFFNDLKANMNTNGFGDGGTGFLPGYIIIALLGLIIFRFLSH